ncbi:MAG TPA: ion channel [Candidatus Bathyarchaeia archaeon]|nr:ion channel [Candidatus Bathyarchaeia archaeon]
MEVMIKRALYYLIKLKGRIFIPFVLVYILIVSGMALFIEPQTFEASYLTAVYWVLTTLATVGFGDYAPVTDAGKAFTIGLYMTGIGLVSVLIGKVITSISHIENLRVGGKMKYSGKQHIILIGWSDKSKLAIQEILASDTSTEIVIIDNLEKAPMIEERLFYIRGDATDEETLLRANLQKAKGVIIFADQITQETNLTKDPLLVDGKTLLIASAITSIEGKMKTSVHVTAEVMHQKHIRLFEHVKVDEFIPTQEMISHAAVRSIYIHGVTHLYSELMSRSCPQGMYEIPRQHEWRTYRDAFMDLLNKGATLVADRGDLNINHKLDVPIPPNAQLYIICDKDTFSRITEEFAQ